MHAQSTLQTRPSLFTASLVAVIVAALTLLPVMAHAQSEDAPRNEQSTDARMQAADAGTRPLLETLEEKASYSTFVEAMKSTGLANALNSGGPYTIFVPTNRAFQSLDEDLSAMSDQEVVTLLRRHIVVGSVPTGKLSGRSTLRVTTGDHLEVGEDGSTVGDARIESPDIKATNGVAHGIDTVLMPTEGEDAKQPRPKEKPSTDKPQQSDEDTSQAGSTPMMSNVRMPVVRMDTTEKDTTEKDTTDTTDAVIGSIAVDHQSLADAGLMH